MSEQLHLHQRRFEKLEKRIFNTGPCADKTLPTTVIESTSSLVPPENFESTSTSNHDQNLTAKNDLHQQNPMHVQIQPIIPNEMSNLSSAGSTSDREPETPEKISILPHQPPLFSKSEKRRKRKRIEIMDRSVSEHLPKTERNKITAYINKTSPKRPSVNMSQNGDIILLHSSTISDTGAKMMTLPGIDQFSPIAPNSPTAIIQQQSQQHLRTTPTQLLGYTTTDLSHSPPTKSENQMISEIVVTPDSVKADLAKKERLIDELQKMNEDIKQQMLETKRKNEASRETIRKLLIDQSTMERKQVKAKCMEESLRLGQFKPERQGEHFRDVWTDGYAFEEMQKKQQKIINERNDIASASQNLRKLRKPSSSVREVRRQQQQAAAGVTQLNCSVVLNASPSTSSSTNLPPSSSSMPLSDDCFVKPEPPRELTMQEYIEQEEIYRLRREHLKKEEMELQSERDRMERQRNRHIRELKRVQYEDASRYKDHVLLNARYLLLSLLGKGGFSEVWRAFDLEENRCVACKIHHVNKEWKEDKKANYVKHALREKDIHKTLDHPRIVKLFDLFTIDNHSFCTVLEYCDGNDLDFYLKQTKHIPEKEARSIIMQVVSALKYLSEIRPPIIHYDLKPANILLQSGSTSGAIKITDFGLSKVMECVDDADSIELTSQGAGTYWYLPPETFVLGHQPPKISSKVDVWSIGVILYQCLYGRRPFGHDQTQAKILEENTILKATDVNFPNKPTVSNTAQDFIRRCLQYRKEERADVHELVHHKLFQPKAPKMSASPSPSSSVSSVPNPPIVQPVSPSTSQQSS